MCDNMSSHMARIAQARPGERPARRVRALEGSVSAHVVWAWTGCTTRVWQSCWLLLTSKCLFLVREGCGDRCGLRGRGISKAKKAVRKGSADSQAGLHRPSDGGWLGPSVTGKAEEEGGPEREPVPGDTLHASTQRAYTRTPAHALRAHTYVQTSRWPLHAATLSFTESSTRLWGLWPAAPQSPWGLWRARPEDGPRRRPLEVGVGTGAEASCVAQSGVCSQGQPRPSASVPCGQLQGCLCGSAQPRAWGQSPGTSLKCTVVSRDICCPGPRVLAADRVEKPSSLLIRTNLRNERSSFKTKRPLREHSSREGAARGSFPHMQVVACPSHNRGTVMRAPVCECVPVYAYV